MLAEEREEEVKYSDSEDEPGDQQVKLISVFTRLAACAQRFSVRYAGAEEVDLYADLAAARQSSGHDHLGKVTAAAKSDFYKGLVLVICWQDTFEEMRCSPGRKSQTTMRLKSLLKPPQICNKRSAHAPGRACKVYHLAYSSSTFTRILGRCIWKIDNQAR